MGPLASGTSHFVGFGRPGGRVLRGDCCHGCRRNPGRGLGSDAVCSVRVRRWARPGGSQQL